MLSQTTGTVERKLEQSLYRCSQLCAEQQKRVEALTDTQRQIKQKLKHLEVLAKHMEEAYALMERVMAAPAGQSRANAPTIQPMNTQAQAQPRGYDEERIARLERAMLRYSARIDDIFQLTQQIAQSTTIPTTPMTTPTAAPHSADASVSLPPPEADIDDRQGTVTEASRSVGDSGDSSDISFQGSDPERLWKASTLLENKRAAHRAQFRARAEEEFRIQNASLSS